MLRLGLGYFYANVGPLSAHTLLHVVPGTYRNILTRETRSELGRSGTKDETLADVIL